MNKLVMIPRKIATPIVVLHYSVLDIKILNCIVIPFQVRPGTAYQSTLIHYRMPTPTSFVRRRSLLGLRTKIIDREVLHLKHKAFAHRQAVQIFLLPRYLTHQCTRQELLTICLRVT